VYPERALLKGPDWEPPSQFLLVKLWEETFPREDELLKRGCKVEYKTIKPFPLGKIHISKMKC
ncbi:hypothetical protein DRP04_14990, partial [Archaeoglobales archaeon]